MKQKIVLLLAVVMLAVAFAGCSNSSEPIQENTIEPAATPIEATEQLDSAIIKIMEDKLTAIETGDYDLYMSTVGKNNQFYKQEQVTWYLSITDETISGLSFEVVSVEMKNEYTGSVTIHQKHKREDEEFDFEYPLLFKYEDGQWYDYGYDFEVAETDRFIIRYMEGEERVEEFTKYLNDAFDHLAEIYDKKPVENYELKLFSDQEMLRQRTAPASPWVFVGWSDADESVKLYSGLGEDYKGYPGVVQHELVHNITLQICNNNLSIWLAEGIAMYDGSAYYGKDTVKLFEGMSKESVGVTIEYLEDNNIYTDELSTEEIFACYSAGYMYCKYICDVYGHDKLMDLFYEAGKKPYNDGDLYSDEFNDANRITTENAIMVVFDMTTEEMSEEYLEWLEELDFESIP